MWFNESGIYFSSDNYTEKISDHCKKCLFSYQFSMISANESYYMASTCQSSIVCLITLDDQFNPINATDRKVNDEYVYDTVISGPYIAIFYGRTLHGNVTYNIDICLLPDFNNCVTLEYNITYSTSNLFGNLVFSYNDTIKGMINKKK